ncbi:MAG TPA: GGDEF domain-containing protein [Gammaproteobacteria bacterium]|nr:GGDEF domain-containing protein [Gammaproteobacteria bacterium]
MPSLSRWLKEKVRFKDTGLNFDAHIEMQTRHLLVTYLYRQSVVGQVASLFCALVLFIGLYRSVPMRPLVVGWLAYSFLVALIRMSMTGIYNRQLAPEKKMNFWKTLFVIGSFAGGIGWGFAGSCLFWFSSDLQQMLITLVLAGITAGAVPILAADLFAAFSFLTTALLPLIIQLFFQQQTYLYSLFSATVIVYFVYMLILSVRSHRLLKQTIGLQFEKEALTRYLKETQEKLDASQEKLNRVATHDLPTGLPNRKLLMVTLAEAIRRAEISQKNFAVLYMNLDHFKFINDAYGYETGDQLLESVIQRVRENLREPDFLARVGGDELAIILENQTDTSTISKIAGHICELLTKPFHIGDHHINMSASIGVSIYPVDGMQADVLMKKADKAMQYIKEHGHNNFHFSTQVSESSHQGRQ